MMPFLILKKWVQPHPLYPSRYIFLEVQRNKEKSKTGANTSAYETLGSLCARGQKPRPSVPTPQRCWLWASCDEWPPSVAHGPWVTPWFKSGTLGVSKPSHCFLSVHPHFVVSKLAFDSTYSKEISHFCCTAQPQNTAAAQGPRGQPALSCHWSLEPREKSMKKGKKEKRFKGKQSLKFGYFSGNLLQSG